MDSVTLIANKKMSLQDITDRISKTKGFKLVYRNGASINDVKFRALVYEKFFLRTLSHASVTILLSETSEMQTVEFVVSGAGVGILNLKHGADSELKREVTEILQECGFGLSFQE